MPEPTLKDVLEAIARIEKNQGEMRGELSDVRTELSDVRTELSDVRTELSDVRTGLARVDGKVDTAGAKIDTVSAKVDAHRAETSRAFALLDGELGRHSDRAHRAIEERLDKLEARATVKRPTARTPRRR